MTNPPVPATPLDVEACVRLLKNLASGAHVRSECEQSERESARLARESALLSALASALTGMGKALAIADEWFGCCDCITTEFGTDERKKQYWALRRAAQPQETSADAK